MNPEPSVAVVIPAHEEAPRVGHVVAAALESGVGSVWVVDDGSRDATEEMARAAGAHTIALLENVGKGGAIAEAVRRIEADLFILLDADLTGLQARHVSALLAPVREGLADTTRGVFEGARWSTTMAQRLAPQLSGQRVVPKDWLADMPALATSRFGVEWLIEHEVRRRNARRVDVTLDGVGQVMKEEKRGAWHGAWSRLRMYRDVVRAMMFRGG